eukprot:CAMPEP_0202862492 /NCGR_PEP_ID=MMETSP1391-20130828/3519_1 /ASSEMBLY_ACC=CAM_ASM_000867 /TAXON_ID=1034604 /ORGANISM="Chlamydomonas leiostraca, Strain SAG 11-49" /LENGTH=104 /DNA_ID=CAMNT_0049542041 /DNA_START=532 /DNA_END=844 /DNA_ORIENTATION=+
MAGPSKASATTAPTAAPGLSMPALSHTTQQRAWTERVAAGCRCASRKVDARAVERGQQAQQLLLAHLARAQLVKPAAVSSAMTLALNSGDTLPFLAAPAPLPAP